MTRRHLQKMTFVDSRALLSCRLFSKLLLRNKLLYMCASRFHKDIKKFAKSPMEIVSVPPIISIYRQALHTFDDRHKNDFETNLNKLKSMMDLLKSEDVGLDEILMSPATWRSKSKAPCTYIKLFQNEIINMSIFVLKPGFKMPLHDHPSMHGLLKVIAGAVNIKSYSEHPLTHEMGGAFTTELAQAEALRLSKGIHSNRKLFAEISHDRICRANSETCTLTPTVSNYHEIQALDLPSAFFDILSPPYDTFIEDIGPRRCHYYRVSSKISTNLVELEETDVPECFYCDQAPYLGPSFG